MNEFMPFTPRTLDIAKIGIEGEHSRNLAHLPQGLAMSKQFLLLAVHRYSYALWSDRMQNTSLTTTTPPRLVGPPREMEQRGLTHIIGISSMKYLGLKEKLEVYYKMRFLSNSGC